MLGDVAKEVMIVQSARIAWEFKTLSFCRKEKNAVSNVIELPIHVAAHNILLLANSNRTS